MLELSCYINLYVFIHAHNKALAKEKIISQDTYRARSSTHSVSLYVQFLGFLLEVIYNIAHFLVKILGRQFLLSIVQDYNAIGKLSQSCFVTAVTIFASAELRKDFLPMFSKV